MHLKLTKTSERDRNTLVILNQIPRGILPDRILLPFFPIPFEAEIGDSQADELLELLSAQAREQLLRYLAEREHSSIQCRDYLKRKSYPPSLIDALLNEFTKKQYLDDTRYVQILINSLLERGKSKRAIITKLKESRLPATLWEETLEQLIDPEQSLENLKDQMLKLLMRYRELSPTKQKEKVFASLYRKGYELDDIHHAWQQTR